MKIAEAGGVQASEDQLMRASANQASLATAQNYLTHPPNVLQRNGILAQINTLQHRKGPAARMVRTFRAATRQQRQ